MKNFYTIIILILINSGWTYSQTSIDQIKKDYYEYKSKEKNYEVFEVEKKIDDVNQTFRFYHDGTNLLYVILNHSSEFHGFTKEYFYKNGKIFFIYSSETEENYFEEPIRKYWQTDYRYYIDNEEPIQIFFKKGYLENSSNLDSLISTIPNKNIYPGQNGNLELEMKNSKALMNTFLGINNYR